MATCNPIVALDVQVSDKEPVSLNNGVFQYIPIDVNMGGGGKYIYIGYKRSNVGDPITAIDFRAFPSKQTTKPKEMGNWEWYPQDLNAGAGGEYIYMFSSTDTSRGKPLLDITIGITDAPTPIQLIGGSWRTNSIDLNQGAGGKYVWFYTTTNLE